MNGYFYLYCVVKCGNCALGINEHIKNLLGHKNEPKPIIVEGPPGPKPKGF
jgi:hypothetical protein